MFKPSLFALSMLGMTLPNFAANDPMTPKEIHLKSVGEKSSRKTPPSIKTSFSPFTGKVKGEKVRVRLQPDLDGYIVRELNNLEYVSVVAQEGDFYCIEPGESVKAYIFRSFVLDGIVEGNRVNVRLEPDLEAPVIGHVNSGDRVEGVVSEKNRKWLEIAPPSNARFYVAKDLIEYAGDPELKAKMAKRKETVEQLLEAANLFAQTELDHEFEEIDFERVKEGFLTIIHEYSDFPSKASGAKEALAKVQEQYLEKRIAYLEEKAALVTHPVGSDRKKSLSSKTQIRMWGPLEEGLYASWAKTNEERSIEDFYEEQRLVGSTITGVLEPFKSPVQNKPGDFILKNKNLPVAYVYSTKVDLDEYVGKQITVVGSPRSNYHFAFPAYFVHSVE